MCHCEGLIRSNPKGIDCGACSELISKESPSLLQLSPRNRFTPRNDMLRIPYISYTLIQPKTQLFPYSVRFHLLDAIILSTSFLSRSSYPCSFRFSIFYHKKPEVHEELKISSETIIEKEDDGED